jgi:GntR family transcriptional regulator
MYQQIKEAIYQEISSGNWPPGQRLMTEEELARKFEVSRMTARHALVELEREGVVARFRALGTYVADHRIRRRFDKLVSFAEMLRDYGMDPEVRTYNFVIQPADNTLAEILNTQPGESLIKTEQLQLADQLPISILKLYIIQALCPGITAKDFERSDYYDFLEEQYGIEIKYADLTIEAIAASDKQAQKLQVASGFPLLQLCRVSYDQYSRPVSYSKAVNRSDKYLIQETVRR